VAHAEMVYSPTAAVSDERRRSAYLFLVKVPAHLRSFVSYTGWRLQSGLHSNLLSSCTSVYTGPHLPTSLTSFVRWQTADVEAR